jgi:hypothetical protein
LLLPPEPTIRGDDLATLLANPVLSEEAAEALVAGSDEPLETTDYEFCQERDPATR